MATIKTGLRRIGMLERALLNKAHVGAVEAGCTFKAIGEVGTTSLGKMLDARRQSGKPTSYLRNINVRWGTFDLSDLQEVPLSDAEVTRFRVRQGDVLVCEGGEPGRCAVWASDREDVCYQKALHRIRVFGELTPEWLSLMLREAVLAGKVNHLLTGTTIKHLPQEKLRMVTIPIPSIEDQRSILLEQAQLANSALVVATSVREVVLRCINLQKRLLRAAIGGELVDQDPTDEPADVLLARIRAEREAAGPKPRKPRARKATTR